MADVVTSPVGEVPPVDAPPSPVRVVGTGLIGTSLGLALTSRGVPVLLDDPDAGALHLAVELGAGHAAPGPGGVAPGTVVVAAPPDAVAGVVAAELAAWPRAVVTDVASVKAGVFAGVAALGGDLDRYVGSHPMAGAERSGPTAARGDLFVDRPWVLCPSPKSSDAAVAAVRALARLVGAVTTTMPAAEHDEAVALVSHLPQVAASLVAARLRTAPPPAVALAGQGLRDVTRIAASDPALWSQILVANAVPVRTALRQLRGDLDRVIDALERVDAGPDGVAGGSPGQVPDAGGRGTARDAVAAVVTDGNAGRSRIPGKHGAPAERYTVVTVAVPDRPGALGRLFDDVGATGVNVEELGLEHVPGRAAGLLEISVLPGSAERLRGGLAGSGWRVVG